MPKATMSSEDKVALAMSAVEEMKAVDPVILDVRGRTVMTDFFIIASGTSNVHIKAIVDRVIDRFADKGIKNKRIEGYQEAVWVLLDYGDVIVHVFAPEEREFYRLEAFWQGSEKGSPPPLSPDER